MPRALSRLSLGGNAGGDALRRFTLPQWKGDVARRRGRSPACLNPQTSQMGLRRTLEQVFAVASRLAGNRRGLADAKANLRRPVRSFALAGGCRGFPGW